MKPLNLITLVLVIIGGLNWGLVGLFDFNLVGAIFGGEDATLARLVYILVGLSAVWQLVPFSRALSTDEPFAEVAPAIRRDR
ncbi:DUF378 domain-containing protein [Methylosinus sp. Sm6]|uniref:DUF378 domain-containing protein n=1 Tax=Methylosinus sp. Sm6 TaxID=2866948 RepID=UPI001C997ECC|nr:DUF378 domain-containing protein [Methylosinus sp. Sm6]MBY6241315.1 DUF378 domain-containing protein [Methylosinus sp. Sm6]